MLICVVAGRLVLRGECCGAPGHCHVERTWLPDAGPGVGMLKVGSGRVGPGTPRKGAVTDECTSRGTRAIDRTIGAWGLAETNLDCEARNLPARIGRVRRRRGVPVGECESTRCHPRGAGEERPLPELQHHLDDVDARVVEGRVSLCGAGAAWPTFATISTQPNFSNQQWRGAGSLAQWFITADGEARQELRLFDHPLAPAASDG